MEKSTQEDITQHGHISFSVPSGFMLDQESTLPAPEKDATVSSLSITFRQPPPSKTFEMKPASPGTPPDAFCIAINLLTLPAEYNEDPEAYMKQTAENIKDHLTDFREDFCKTGKINGNCATANQIFFNAGSLPLFRLSMAWILAEEMVTLTTNVLKSDLDYGWNSLRSLANSIKSNENSVS